MHTHMKIGVFLFSLIACVTFCTSCSKSGAGNSIDVSTLDPFTQAMAYAKGGDASSLKAVIAANPAIVNGTGPGGMTLLHYAVIASQLKTVKLLLESGADVNARDEEGMTPLQLGEKEHVKEEVLDVVRGAGGG